MNLPVGQQHHFQVEAITTDRLAELYARVQSSVSIYTSYGLAGYEDFVRYMRDAVLVVRFSFGLAIAKRGEYPHIVDAHLVVWNSGVFRERGALFAAARQVMDLTGSTRVETKFPSHIRGLHVILRNEGFVEEGKLRNYMQVGSEYFDASIYAVVR